MNKPLIHPLVPMAAFSLLVTGCLGLYLGAARLPSQNFQTVVVLIWYLLLLIWVDADARRAGRTPCFDFGLFLWMTFPISVVWYCVWSRRWRGALLLAALGGLTIGPYVLVGLLRLVLRAIR